MSSLGKLVELRYLDRALGMRNRHFLLLDVLAALVAPTLAMTLRSDRLDWWPEYGVAVAFYTCIALGARLLAFHQYELYRRYWRYGNTSDFLRVLKAMVLTTSLLTLAFAAGQRVLSARGLSIPRSLPILDGMLVGLAVGGSRLSLRGLNHWLQQRRKGSAGERVLIVGAGEAGTMVVREMRSKPQLGLVPWAFADDDAAKQNAWIEVLPVLGTCAQVPALVKAHGIQQILVAMPSAPFARLHQVLATCRSTGLPTYCLPGTYELLAGYKTLSPMPQIDINQLLQRQPVEFDRARAEAILRGAKVLITGAGGSIGRELCRQIARLEPAELILLGHGENSIFECALDLRLAFPTLDTRPVIADVRDAARVSHIVETYQPDAIYHAAAHKHVPLMEASVDEALTNNVLGTLNVLKAAEHHGVARFVLISTDKAVNPTNVMGATKRLAELLTVAAAQRSGRAYLAVRFGNVLGSRGSVVPVFQRQIAAGGPVNVTHPEMCRYFMTIPEAVQLVIQASVIGRGAEVFVLDMGQPVRVVDLAEELIRLSGLEPGRDIEIAFTGVRPGEKLSEELFLDQETCRNTECPKIRVAQTQTQTMVQFELLERLVEELADLACATRSMRTDEQLRTFLTQACRLIDGYQASPKPLSPPLPTRRRERRGVRTAVGGV